MKLKNIPDILKLLPPMHRFFGLAIILVEIFLGYSITRLSGAAQIIAILSFFFIVLAAMFFVFSLVHTEKERAVKEKEEAVKEKEKVVNAKHGIVNYWYSRTKALNQIMDKVLESENEIFISGIILNSIMGWIKDKNFAEELARSIQKYKNLKVTFVSLNYRRRDKTVKKIVDFLYQEKIPDFKSNWHVNSLLLKKFKENVSARLIVDEQKRIIFRYYTDMIPNHYIIKVDKNLYVSSYYYGVGATCCLMELSRTKNKGLFEFYEEEVEYIKKHSKKYSP